jgi:DNA-directed RNA polymerase subunit RPC12/RpoP
METMAAGRTLRCSACAHAVVAWDDGNPYYVDAFGEKVYAHHPSPERERCTENEVPVLCLGCGAEAVRDTAAPIVRCPACGARKLVAVWRLEGRRCPHCRLGSFAMDPESFIVS